MEDICEFTGFNANSHRNLEVQPSAIDIWLDFMSLRDLVHSAPESNGVYLKRLTCCARSRSLLVATNMEGILSRLYCCCVRAVRQSKVIEERRRHWAHPEVTDVRKRVRVARIIHVYDHIDLILLCRTQSFGLVLASKLLQLNRQNISLNGKVTGR